MTPDEARFEEWMDQLYAEHKIQAVEEFTDERLQSFYRDNPLIPQRPFEALVEARKLLKDHPTAAHVFSVVAIEVGLKLALLKPLLYGLVHSGSAAEMIAELALRHTRFDFFHKILFQILSEHGGIDLRSFTREGASKTLLEEITEVQKQRDRILHRAESASLKEATHCLDVAGCVLENLFVSVLKNLGFHLHRDFQICNQWGCSLPPYA